MNRVWRDDQEERGRVEDEDGKEKEMENINSKHSIKLKEENKNEADQHEVQESPPWEKEAHFLFSYIFH